MRKFLIQLAVFFGILFVADRATNMILTNSRPADYDLFLTAKTDFFNQTHPTDILIIGDSHVADALDPRTIEKQSGLRAYNLGVYHAAPYENYYLTKAALAHLDEPPKMIVLGTNPSMFRWANTAGNYTPLTLPWPAKFELTRNSAEGFNVDFFSKAFRERQLFRAVLNRLKGIAPQPTREVEDVYRGHLKFYNQITNTNWIPEAASLEFKMKAVQIEYFEKTILLARAAGIPVVVVHPPIWKQDMEVLRTTAAYKDFEQIISDLVLKHQLNEYPSTPENNSTDFAKSDFLDSRHLNYSGSEKFTGGFALYCGEFACW